MTNGHATATLETIGNVTNGALATIDLSRPYVANVRFRGITDLLFHAWSTDSVEAKGKAKKGSAAKKTDDVESYVYRNTDGHICIPGVYFTRPMTNSKCGAAKFRQDPRSPRKSALDLYASGVVSLTGMTPLLAAGTGLPTKEWDYIDRRRVVVQHSAITRCRPAFVKGWTCDVQFLVTTPEYISPDDLHSCLADAGRLVGTGDFRPTFGRFAIDRFEIGLED